MNAKRVVIACASFKGTLSSRLAGQAIARGLGRAGIDSVVVSLADGGEGLVEALVSQLPSAYLVETIVRGPLLDQVIARFGVVGPSNDATAIIEMAASSGLSLVPEWKRDAKITTTLGVGDQIRAALELPNVRLTRILLGIGGSATNDGGAGLAQALGARLLDVNGDELPPGGAMLNQLAHIDISRLDKRLQNIEFTVACDVKNILCGDQGASFVYGPQKGASGTDVRLLDAALKHYADIIERDLGKAIRDVPGSGAAGGLGAGLVTFCNAKLVSGIELLLDTIGFDDLLEQASFVVTGEGRLDGQTLMGKAPLGVARRAVTKKLECIAIGGDVEMVSKNELLRHFVHIESLDAFAGSLERAKTNAGEALDELAYMNGHAWFKFAHK